MSQSPDISAPENGSRKIRRIAGHLLKAALAVILVFWLVKSGRLDFSVLSAASFDSRAIGLILAAALCVFAGQWLLALRLSMLLKSRLDVPFFRALGLTMIGSFSGSVLPGLVSGDAVKALYLFGDATGRRSQAVAVVMIDRAIGLFSLFGLGALCAGVAWVTGAITIHPSFLLVAPAVTLGLTLGAMLAAQKSFRQMRIVQGLLDRFPSSLRNLANHLFNFLEHPRLLLCAVGLSLANHALVVVSFVVAGLLIHEALAPFAHFVMGPLAMVMNILPLTPGGIGLTEGAFSFLYENLGSPNGATIGLLGRLIQYLTFTAGGTAALLLVRMRRHSQPGPLPE